MIRWPRLGARAPGGGRWVVLDVESRGLDPRRDQLLAIAAIGLRLDGRGLRIVLGDSFEVVLRQPPTGAPDKPNILVHGIGVEQQAGGVDVAQALTEFERFTGDSPLIGFHAAFDRMLIERACRAAHACMPAGDWLDVEQLATVTQPPPTSRSLDEWLLHFGIVCAARHRAAADALATAELLLALLPAATKETTLDFAALKRIAAHHRWLRRGARH